MTTFKGRTKLYVRGTMVTLWVKLPSRTANGLLLLSKQRGCTAAQMLRDAIDFFIESAQDLGRLPDPIPEADPEPVTWEPPEPELPAPDRSLLAEIDPASVIISPPVNAAPGDCLVTALRRQERAG